ncbi:hypothetical protein Q765_02600 [Flavobacterium rivuli WB 3.3-2 = DSM 21788]|uniref:Uncharacterized protein n=1 Tax=Flavobacterium rivuli WB 3.3-2 = DSM 21788 TaxID=1121895 RepID=A0A0A2M5N3_9FLAO|nr:hypothetical protein [Flavobacterium rivuli]KGO87977.1 hypothetical protein Q765_02600 [Flavobacterium rivuli WB 3.3-2 = DSM 21788]
MKRKVIIVLVLISLLIIDRFLWMPERVETSWLNERGRNLGDPISCNQDFKLNGSEIIFLNNKDSVDYPTVYKNRKGDFYLAGCYFGYLFIYDKSKDDMIIYCDG